jgi:hypothetical protein
VGTTFQNRSAAFLWGFAAVWLAMLMVFSYLVVRDGPPSGYSQSVTAMVLALFWLGGLGLGAFVVSKPCIRVRVDQGGNVSATWRYPHRVVRRVFLAETVLPAQIVESLDSDGDPYFRVRVTTSRGESIDIAEGHSRVACERTCERFNSELNSICSTRGPIAGRDDA